MVFGIEYLRRRIHNTPMRVRPHVNPFTFTDPIPPIEWAKWGFNPTDIDLEIGSASGLFLQHYAVAFPDRHILGIEVRKPLVITANQRLQRDGIHNAKVIYGSAERVIQDGILAPMIRSVYVFHPDPWFKKRHHNRRVIRPALFDILEPKLHPQAKLYLSTDVPELAQWMQSMLSQRAHWKRVPDDGFFDTHYHTNWARFSQLDQRTEWTAVYGYQV